MDISSLKTELSRRIETCDDYSSLYKTYYVMTADKVTTQSKELFESRGLSTDSADFEYFLNSVMYDPNSGRTSEDTVSLIKRIQSGSILDQDYLTKTDKTVTSIRSMVDPSLSDESLRKMLNYVPTTFSNSSVGKGEYALILLSNGATKPRTGGDLHFGGKDIEIKSSGAKMASQTSHISLSAIRTHVIFWLEEKTGDTYGDIPNLTAKNVHGFYYEVLGRDWGRVIELLRFVFSKVMYLAKPGDLDWINSSLIVDGEFNYFDFCKKLAIFEFTYYRACDRFDRIVFLNPENFNVMSTDVMNEDLIENFTLRQGFAFKSERIQTNYFSLK